MVMAWTQHHLPLLTFQNGQCNQYHAHSDIIPQSFRLGRESHNSFPKMDDLDFTFDTGVDVDTQQRKTVVWSDPSVSS